MDMSTEQQEQVSEKIYYSTGEVAKMFDLTVSNVRFWEQEFDVLRPKKNSRGDRFFTKKDVEYFRLIYHLVKEKGYTLEGAKKKLQQNPDDEMDKLQLVTSLKEVRKFFSDLRNRLDKQKES